MSDELIIRQHDERIDELEAVMLNKGEVIDCPLVHRFTDGMYIREIFMPKDSLITSKIHLTNHPFTISKGEVAVSIDGNEWVEYSAPFTGITQKGTRRILYIISDCIWTTYHPIPRIKGSDNDLSDEEKINLAETIEDEILEPHINCITGTNINSDYKKALENNKNLLV